MGEWGARWLELEPHHADPAYVLFATSRLVDVERAPAHGLVVQTVERIALMVSKIGRCHVAGFGGSADEPNVPDGW
jgi:hypothetical protein